MQFMMAMTVIDNGFSSLLFRTRPDFSGYWPAAQKHGMTRQDFQSAIRDLELIARSSIKTCDLHLTGR